MLKKSVLVVAMLLVATNLWAVKTLDVSAGVHNLGSTSSYQGNASNEDEVCIFCHTPHGGSLNGPLWNRTMGTTAFTHYTSATLSTYMKDLSPTRPVNPESLLCMSCHDGTVAMNSIINSSNRTGALPNNSDTMFDPSFGLGATPVIGEPISTGGKSLTDDHPISFSYYSAAAGNNKLQPVSPGTDPRDKGIRLFGAVAMGGLKVECSSCHDPHINHSSTGDVNYAPFLVMPNTGSALCLACHIK